MASPPFSSTSSARAFGDLISWRPFTTCSRSVSATPRTDFLKALSDFHVSEHREKIHLKTWQERSRRRLPEQAQQTEKRGLIPPTGKHRPTMTQPCQPVFTGLLQAALANEPKSGQDSTNSANIYAITRNDYSKDGNKGFYSYFPGLFAIPCSTA